MTRLSLVIPCYNEAANLPLLVDRIHDAFPDDAGIEVVLVDNGSTDTSPEVLAGLTEASPIVRSVRVAVNQGYGFGILSGLEAARGEILGWTHADMQTDPADALTGLALFGQAADPTRLFVKGRRVGRPIADRIFTGGMSVFETALMGCLLTDINAQPTMFHRRFHETWQDPPHDFSLDLFAFYRARRAGLTVERFPVTFGERAHGASHWNVDFRAKLKFIKRTADYSFRLRFRRS